jgi:transposase InsO family protein
MCALLGVSRSGFYAWSSRPESARKRQDRRLAVEIRAHFRASRGRYGSPRILLDLRDQGICVGRKRVARLMRQEGITACGRRRFRGTTDSAHGLPVAPNLLDRAFTIEGLDTVWAGDITYVPTQEGWLYLAVLLDLASRYVVGWATSDSLEDELTLTALDRAVETRRPPRGLIHHSDQGSQYASRDYQLRLAARGLVPSMSRKGNCWDNAAVESFFSSFKREELPDGGFVTKQQAREKIFEYIEVFYNRNRRHSTLGGISPARFEANLRQLAA